MSRFYFHLTHSTDIRDENGVELESLHAAKCHAVKMIADDLCETPDKFWKTEIYRVTVANAEGLTLLSVDLSCQRAPALWLDMPKVRA